MNCVEFRRQLGVDPQSNQAEFLRHRGECLRCAETAERAAGFERKLLRALTVEVPAQLADSILFAQTTAERQRRATVRRRGGFLAVAAALVLAIGMVGVRAQAEPLPDEAIAHLHREADALATTQAIASSDVVRAFAERGLVLKRIPADISFVACCPLAKHRTVHLVMLNGDDPISVIYIVDKRVHAREEFERDGMQGRILPLANGSLILVAKKAAAFDRVEAVWRDALI